MASWHMASRLRGRLPWNEIERQESKELSYGSCEMDDECCYGWHVEEGHEKAVNDL